VKGNKDLGRDDGVRVLVFGVGNLLRSDDGVGLHVIEALRKEEIKDKIDLIEALSGLDILDAIKGYDRIILVDAIKTGGEPGTIYKLSLEDIQDKHTNHSFSTHLNMDLQTMLELGNRLFPGKIPKDIRIIAVEVEDVTTISDRCTPKVRKAIPKAVDMIKGLI
jgi:hydrogenase maturation protease